MSFAARILDAWPARHPDGARVTFTRSRRQRAVRAATSIARLAIAGPDEWRRTARRALLDASRMLVAVLEERPAPAVQAAAHEPFPMDEIIEEPIERIEEHSDSDWAAWM